jgi:tetratricopeptide (TPR) repeat protein
LDDGRLAVAGAPGGADAADADSAFTRAEARYAARDFPAAARSYQEALRLAAPDWPRYARTVESLLFALAKADDCATSIEVARGALPRLRHTPSALTISGTGLDCALQSPATDPGRAQTVAFFEKAAREAVASPKTGAAADDRSGLYGVLLGARRDAKDDAGTRQVAAEWARFLEDEAGRAKTPEARAVFDSHRLSVYLELGQPARAIPMLEASARDFPKDYNPPARLAVAYKEMKRWDDALAAADRALALGSGPRMLRILGTRAEVLLAKGDRAGARATLERALEAAQDMPAGQRSERTIAAVRKRLDALE